MMLSQVWKIFFVVLFYWIVSIATVFVNKLLLSSDSVHLDAPFFITWSQCLFTMLYYVAYDHLVTNQDTRCTPFTLKSVKVVLPVSIIFAAMIMFNNLCLKNVDVSFYFIGRSLTTVFNVCLTYVFLREITSLKVCFCCAIIIFGFWLGVDQEQLTGSFSLTGTIFGILASFSVALYSVRVKQVLPEVNNSVWILAYYNNVYSTMLFVPFILVSGELSELANVENAKNVYFWLLLLGSGVCGLTIGYATTLQIKYTSPLTHNISGTAKACVQTVIASYFFNEQKPWIWWISNWTVLGGSTAYTFVKQKEMEKRRNAIVA